MAAGAASVARSGGWSRSGVGGSAASLGLTSDSYLAATSDECNHAGPTMRDDASMLRRRAAGAAAGAAGGPTLG